MTATITATQEELMKESMMDYLSDILYNGYDPHRVFDLVNKAMVDNNLQPLDEETWEEVNPGFEVRVS